jgi:CubicO group peptidase (beta-lactamase class C family)
MEPFTVAPSVASRVPPQSAAEISRPEVYRLVLVLFLSSLIIVVALTLNLPNTAKAAEPSTTKATIEGRVQELIPDIEAYITSGMKGFDIPGLAIGIVANNRLIYAKGFGVRSKSNGLPVDTRTVFQIGSTTKAFLTATMAIMVDRGKLRWDDRVVDLYPEFRLKDPWVTREFRVLANGDGGTGEAFLAVIKALQPVVEPLAAPSEKWAP